MFYIKEFILLEGGNDYQEGRSNNRGEDVVFRAGC